MVEHDLVKIRTEIERHFLWKELCYIMRRAVFDFGPDHEKIFVEENEYVRKSLNWMMEE